MVENDDDYIDTDMKNMDENAKKRIQDILQDYKDQMQKYNPPSGDEDKPKTGNKLNYSSLFSDISLIRTAYFTNSWSLRDFIF